MGEYGRIRPSAVSGATEAVLATGSGRVAYQLAAPKTRRGEADDGKDHQTTVPSVFSFREATDRMATNAKAVRDTSGIGIPKTS